MAQTKKKRQRKHRGTQGGRVDANRRPSRPRSRAEAKARARSNVKRAPRGDQPPTWRSSIVRGLVAALIFTVLLMLIFGRSFGSALALGGLGWSVSHFTTPLIMGFLADRYGLVTGFYVIGALALACALAIAWMRRWAFAKRP